MNRPLRLFLAVSLAAGTAAMLAACPFRGGEGEPLPIQPGSVPSGTTLTVTAEKPVLVIGETSPVTVNVPSTTSVQYSSSAPGVATIDAKGVLTAVNVGSTTIKATVGMVSATTTVRVVTSLAPELMNVQSVEIQPGSQTVQRVGSQLIFSAVVRDDQNAPIPGAGVYWFSANPAVATITSGGVLTIVGTGTTEVTASAGDKRSGPSVITVPGGSVNVNVDFGAN